MMCNCTWQVIDSHMHTSLVDFLAIIEEPTTQEPKETEDFPLYVIIVIGAGGGLILLIFIVLICCAARYYVRSSKFQICMAQII